MAPSLGRPTLVALGVSLVLAALAGNSVAYATSNRQSSEPLGPDLIVTHGQLHGTNWATQGHAEKFTWKHQTKNRGGKTSQKSHTSLELVNQHGAVALDTLRVPALSPGEAQKGKGKFTARFDDGTYDYGSYTPRICANRGHKVPEGEDDNNCKELGHLFYLVPFVFKGTVGGVGSLVPGVIMTWTGTVTADLEGVQYADGGLFDYVFYAGSLTYTVAGVDGEGCSWSGTGSYNPATRLTELNTIFGANSRYGAWAAVEPHYNFPVTVTCPGHGATTAAISPTQWGHGRWLDTGLFDRGLGDPGVDTLSGQFNDGHVGGSTTYTWDLKAGETG